MQLYKYRVYSAAARCAMRTCSYVQQLPLIIWRGNCVRAAMALHLPVLVWCYFSLCDLQSRSPKFRERTLQLCTGPLSWLAGWMR